VIASNNDGVWNQKGAALALYLKPYFYQTYWFYALGVLLIAMLGWQLYRLRVRNMEAQFAAVLGERTRIAREIHDNLAQEMAEFRCSWRSLRAPCRPARKRLQRI